MDSQSQWPTQNDLPEKVRSRAIALLNQQLADALDLALQAGATARAGIDAANALPDADTADLFTEISRGVEKLLWRVEAHV